MVTGPRTDALAVGNSAVVSARFAEVLVALLDPYLIERRQHTSIPAWLVDGHRVLAEIARSGRVSANGNGGSARAASSAHSEPRLMTAEEVAVVVDRTPHRVRELARISELTPVRTKPYLFHPDEVDAYLKRRGNA